MNNLLKNANNFKGCVFIITQNMHYSTYKLTFLNSNMKNIILYTKSKFHIVFSSIIKSNNKKQKENRISYIEFENTKEIPD